MQSIQLRNDTLIDIATFLVRRWSEKENVTVEFSKIKQSETRLKELQDEIARLREIDRQISERVDREADDSIVIECSADLDLAMQYESE